MLDLLEATFIGRWADALSQVAPTRAADTARRLWNDTANAWDHYSKPIDELLRSWGLDEEPRILPDLLDRPSTSLRDLLPNLTPAAAVYLDAFIRLARPLLQRTDLSDAVRTFLRTPHHGDADLHECMALLHGFLVAASTPSVPPEVQNALARAFWGRLRASADDAQTMRTEIDRALRIAVAEARHGRSPVPPPAGTDCPRSPPVLLRLARESETAPHLWSSVPADASRNLDRYLPPT